MKKNIVIIILSLLIIGLATYIFVPTDSIKLPWSKNPLEGTVWRNSQDILGFTTTYILEFSDEETVYFISSWDERIEGVYSISGNTVVLSFNSENNKTINGTFSENSMTITYYKEESSLFRKNKQPEIVEKTMVFLKDK